MNLDRRQLIGSGGAMSLGLLGTGLLDAPARAATGVRHRGRGRGGRPRPFPPLVDGELLALPPGFGYSVVAESGVTTMLDGSPTPERPDGTLAVTRGDGYRVIQNHEAKPGSKQPVPLTPGTVYDHGALGGGCTIMDVTRGGARVAEWVGLSGTFNNCSGGATPWGSWLSCEENEDRAGTVIKTATLEEDHGYVYEVFPDHPSQQSPGPIKAWGRAQHEAVVLHPTRTRAYLTEDSKDPSGLFYRWTSRDGSRLRPPIAEHLGAHAGTLEAMAVHGPDGSILPDLAYVTSAQLGRRFRTSWRKVPDRDATTVSLRSQFDDGEVTRGKKLEGAWAGRRGMYFTSSFAAVEDVPADATPHDGQLWFLDFRSETLTLVAYFPYNPLLHSEVPDWETALGRSLDLAFDGPDNVHVSPYGSLILCEDGDTAQHTLAWSRKTGAQAVARNLMVAEQSDDGGNSYSEMTGPCFSPDGRVLFVSVQTPGHTFAIRGPWYRYL